MPRSYGTMSGEMRLGAPVPCDRDSPEAWIETLRARGFRTAYWPLPDDAGADEVAGYADAAAAAGVVLGEVGAWSNPLNPNDATRAAAIERCKSRLELADRVGARCCVNIAGTRSDSLDGPHPDDLTPDTFALIVDSVRDILDTVGPQRTFYTLEPMPWALPDSADSYLELIRAIARPRFAVHLDPVNLINSPAKYYDNAGLLRECFAKLGPHIKVVHAKDLTLTNELTLHMPEVRPGLGGLDYRAFLIEMAALDRDTPLLLEHLRTDDEYEAAVAYVRGVAGELGLEV
jgi:sugar phosphate isomerase/epimerase